MGLQGQMETVMKRETRVIRKETKTMMRTNAKMMKQILMKKSMSKSPTQNPLKRI